MTTAMLDRAAKARAEHVEAALKADGVPCVLTAEAAKDTLGFTNARTIHRMIERGELSGFLLGGRWRIRRGELARLVAAREGR